jgi:hypothetical protein
VKLSRKAKARIIVYGGLLISLLVPLLVYIYANLRTYSIADFTELDFGMKYDDVVGLMGIPASGGWLKHAGNYTGISYNLNDGSKIRIIFFARSSLRDITIVDPSGRSFRLQRDFNMGRRTATVE